LRCQIEEASLAPLGVELGIIKICGDGFLKQMVRYIAGTIFEVGRGRVSLEQVASYLRDHYEEKLSPKAKAHGLHLMLISES
jgi:tRNA pseudouridine38-40 synthase